MKQFTYTIWYVSAQEIAADADLKGMNSGFYFLNYANEFVGPYSSTPEAVKAKDYFDGRFGRDA